MKSTISKYGVAKSSSFAVNITPPVGLKDDFVNDLPTLISMADVPTFSFNTQTVKHSGYGSEEHRISEAITEEITLTIIGDASGRVLKFFDSWMALSHNHNVIGGTNTYGLPPMTSNFPDQYWGTVDIYMYDPAGDKYRTITLHDAFPITRGPVTLGWQQVDQLVEINVSFKYRVQTSDVIDKLATNQNPTSSLTSTNNRNIDRLQSIIPNPNIDQYVERLKAF